jgi:hypothetical protein
MPLRLTDDQLDIILLAAQPLAPHQRDGFLQAVANELAGCQELGPGLVSRVCRQVQRAHFDPPELSHDASKYR